QAQLQWPKHTLQVQQLYITSHQQRINEQIYLRGQHWQLDQLPLGMGELQFMLSNAPQFPWLSFIQSPSSLLLITDYLANIYWQEMQRSASIINIKRFAWQQDQQAANLTATIALS